MSNAGGGAQNPSILRDRRVARVIDREIAPIWNDRFARLIFRNLPQRNGQFVLDLHCGPGHSTAEILQRLDDTSRVLAIEPDETLVEIAKTRVRAEWRNRVYFKPGNFDDVTSMAASTYDLVIANLVLGEGVEQAPALGELMRVTKPGGHILATLPLAGTWDEVEDIFAEVLRDAGLTQAVRRLERLRSLRPPAPLLGETLRQLGLGRDHFVIEHERLQMIFPSGREFLFAPVVEHGPLRLWKAIIGNDGSPQELFWRLKESIDTYYAGHVLAVSVVAGLVHIRIPDNSPGPSLAARYWSHYPELDRLWGGLAGQTTGRRPVLPFSETDVDDFDLDIDMDFGGDASADEAEGEAEAAEPEVAAAPEPEPAPVIAEPEPPLPPYGFDHWEEPSERPLEPAGSAAAAHEHEEVEAGAEAEEAPGAAVGVPTDDEAEEAGVGVPTDDEAEEAAGVGVPADDEAAEAAVGVPADDEAAEAAVGVPADEEAEEAGVGVPADDEAAAADDEAAEAGLGVPADDGAGVVAVGVPADDEAEAASPTAAPTDDAEAAEAAEVAVGVPADDEADAAGVGVPTDDVAEEAPQGGALAGAADGAPESADAAEEDAAPSTTEAATDADDAPTPTSEAAPEAREPAPADDEDAAAPTTPAEPGGAPEAAQATDAAAETAETAETAGEEPGKPSSGLPLAGGRRPLGLPKIGERKGSLPTFRAPSFAPPRPARAGEAAEAGSTPSGGGEGAAAQKPALPRFAINLPKPSVAAATPSAPSGAADPTPAPAPAPAVEAAAPAAPPSEAAAAEVAEEEIVDEVELIEEAEPLAEEPKPAAPPPPPRPTFKPRPLLPIIAPPDKKPKG